MSARDALTVTAAGRAVGVRDGVADVLVLLDSGATIPLASVSAPAAVPAPSTGASLRVVPRLDAVVSYADAPTEPEVSAFREALSAGIPEPLRTLLPAEGDLAGPLADICAGLIEQRRHETADLDRRRGERDEATARAAYSRAALSVRDPRLSLDEASEDPLIAALRVVGQVQGFTVRRPPHDVGAPDDLQRIAAIAHASGVRFRIVRPSHGWRRSRSQTLLAFRQDPDGTVAPVAVVPNATGFRVSAGVGQGWQRLTSSTQLQPQALRFYPSLPRDRAVRASDVARIAFRGTRRDWVWVVALAAAVAVLGLLTPILTNRLLGTVIPAGRLHLLWQAGLALVSAAVLAGIFAFSQYRVMSRITQRAIERVQPAFWDRVMGQPAGFFRDYPSGDLSVRVMAVDSLQQLVNVQVIGALLAAVFSLVNVILMFSYQPMLGLAGVVFLVLTALVMYAGVRSLEQLYLDSVHAQLSSTSWVVQLLVGIGKIRLAGAETRLESRYLDLVRDQVVAISRMTKVLGRVIAWGLLAAALAPAVFVTIVYLYGGIQNPDLNPATFLAFTSAFSACFGAFLAMTSVLLPLGSAKPIFELLRPIMDAVPETSDRRSDPGRLTGRVELRKVTFRYGPDDPVVLNELSFTVSPGETVALVGPSGSGKSTTIRMLLGFDRPTDGMVLYDDKPLDSLDLELVRRQLGVVVQNGQLMRAPLVDNILGGTAASMDQVWEAAWSAALDEEIKAMPMGMHTLVDPQLVSGGQAQRILLARAFLRKPRIVILDEATSALDNAAQAHVSQAMDRLGATLIVVAHRLSTIRSADRILVMVDGAVAEEGTFDELMARDAVFARIARRQMV